MCGAPRRSANGIAYVDAGTSGGIWGLQEGYCLMVGGDADVCQRLEPIFLTLAPPDGYLRVGDTGAGHYVKMIHNGIEYGLMQAYAEGFELMHASDYHVDVAKVASLWMHGSVVRSWLLELTARALAEDPDLSKLDALRRGLRRRTLDARRGDRAQRAGAGADRRALHALPIARRQPVRRTAARGAASAVWRSRRRSRAEAPCATQ